MIYIKRKFHICTGHRVHLHESKCNNIHGHNYIIWVTATAPKLDTLGRVIDFSVLKGLIDPWLQKHWDHGFIYYAGDAEMKLLFTEMKEHKSYALAVNPTAENLGKHLLYDVIPTLLWGTDVTAVEVEVQETENCIATVRLSDG